MSIIGNDNPFLLHSKSLKYYGTSCRYTIPMAGNLVLTIHRIGRAYKRCAKQTLKELFWSTVVYFVNLKRYIFEEVISILMKRFQADIAELAADKHADVWTASVYSLTSRGGLSRRNTNNKCDASWNTTTEPWSRKQQVWEQRKFV